jgi:hypothetical protein
MADKITISKTLSIRDCGHDEIWLQEKIADNPIILGLGSSLVRQSANAPPSGEK